MTTALSNDDADDDWGGYGASHVNHESEGDASNSSTSDDSGDDSDDADDHATSPILPILLPPPSLSWWSLKQPLAKRGLNRMAFIRSVFALRAYTPKYNP